jgi:hypothetical protein
VSPVLSILCATSAHHRGDFAPFFPPNQETCHCLTTTSVAVDIGQVDKITAPLWLLSFHETTGVFHIRDIPATVVAPLDKLFTLQHYLFFSDHHLHSLATSHLIQNSASQPAGRAWVEFFTRKISGFLARPPSLFGCWDFPILILHTLL